MPGPLEGVRVFDLTVFMVGPWASMQLGALGADVIHVEEPGSIHNSRIWVPPFKQETSIGYIVWNLNKRSILLDLKQEEDRETAYRLLATCDVLVENMRPGAAERLGMAYETVAKINPRLVYVSGSGFGRKGPLQDKPANDPVIQTFTGSASINGSPGGLCQLYRHHTQLDATTGNYMCQAALLGLMGREATGRGQRIDVNMLAVSAALQGPRMAEFFATGKNPPLLGSACANVVPHQAFLCQDKDYLAVGVTEERHWAPFCETLGLPELIDDPRFAGNRSRVERRDDLIPILEQAFLAKPRYWWAMELARRGVPCSRFFQWDELRFHPQVTENEHVVQVDTPWGAIYAGGPPWKLSATPASMRSSPEPGEHMASILDELSRAASPEAPHPVRAEPVEAPSYALEPAGVSAPLSAQGKNLLVLDCTQGIAGPYCGMQLGDAGADVIKVETPGGDAVRGWGPPFANDESAAFLALNRNKRSLVLDMGTPEGKAAFRRLARQADVLLEDWGVGAAEELGCGYESLAWDNPRLVYCALTAFGEKGPLRTRPGSELVAQAMGEATSSLGAIGEAPVRMGADLAGMTTGVFAFQGVLAALLHRARSGRGQRVGASLLGSLMFMRGTLWAAHSDPDEWTGFHLDSYVKPPDHAYEAKDGQFYFTFTRGLTDKQWAAFMDETGMSEHRGDPRFAGYRDPLGLGRYGYVVQDLWNRRLRQRSFEELAEIIERFGGNAWRLHDYRRFFDHPQVQALGIKVQVEHPNGGIYSSVGVPWEMHGTPSAIRRAPPRLGQHTDAVLAQLGFDRGEVRRMRDHKVVA